MLNFPLPLLIQGLVDGALSAGGFSPLLVLALLGVFAGQAGASLAVAHVAGPVGLGVVRDLRHALYSRLQRLGLPFFDRVPAGAIISRLMDDVAVVQALVTSQALAILADLGTVAAVLVLLLWRDLGVAFMAFLVIGAYAVLFAAFGRWIRDGTTEVRERLDRIFGHLKERLDAAVVVRACDGQDAEIAEFARRIHEAHGPRVRVGCLAATLSNLSAGLSGVGTTLVFGVGAIGALSGRMTPGEAVSAAALAALVFGPIARLSDLMSAFHQAAASLERLGEILDGDPGIAEATSPEPIGRPCGLVEFDGVSFAYRPGRPAVREISLRAEPGQTVAIVGPTGCGKTTLANLLLRFHDPIAGEIRLDGVPIRRIATADLRRQVGIVPQEPVVFTASLADNIRYGTPGARDEQVIQAAHAALVDEFARSLPNGYDTIVGEGGHRLSQGERQRLAIARAFCKDPAIVILDEATGSLDSAGEARIQEALANLLAGRTTLVIAHRLSTVVDADTIVVMDDGRIVQAGTHDELRDDPNGPYARLWERASGGLLAAEGWRADESAEVPPRPAVANVGGLHDATRERREIEVG